MSVRYFWAAVMWTCGMLMLGANIQWASAGHSAPDTVGNIMVWSIPWVFAVAAIVLAAPPRSEVRGKKVNK